MYVLGHSCDRAQLLLTLTLIDSIEDNDNLQIQDKFMGIALGVIVTRKKKKTCRC